MVQVQESYARAEQPREQGEVFRQLDEAEEFAKGLGDLVRDLAARLEPVTTPSDGNIPGQMGEIQDRKLTSGLAQRLEEHTATLRALSIQLRMQVDRLEL
jgi:hypothetical protein